MKNHIRRIVALGIFFIMLVVSIFIALNDFNLTGNIIWEPANNNNCNDTQIGIIWSSVFIEPDSDTIILKENEAGGNCEKYIAYKNNSDGELWVFFGENYNLTSWGGDYLYFNGSRILNQFNLSFGYLNTTSSFIELFNDANGIDSKINILGGVIWDDLTNWSVSDTNDINNKLTNLYRFDSLYGEDFSDSDENYFLFNEQEFNIGINYSELNISIYKNESLSQGVSSIVVYDTTFIIDFIRTLPNYKFEVNSSWNFAFNLSDYFNVSDDVSIEFESTGVGNTNGELINYTINKGVVSFMPATNFNNSLEFKLVANNPAGDNIYSNIFTVAIVVGNNAPVLIKNFENMNISYDGNVSIVLGDYFEDSDNDSLSYNISKIGGVNLSVSGGVLTFWLNDDFSVYAKLMVNANDGIESVGGNWFYLYQYVSIESLVEINESDSTNLIEEEISSGESESVVDNSVDEKDTNWIKLLVWGIIIIVVLGIIMFMIWFFILKKDDESVIPSSPSNSPINPKTIPPNTSVNRVAPRIISRAAPQKRVAPAQAHPIKNY